MSWTTYVFLQVEYSVYVLRQASRRGWRIGQTEPVEVYHFAYEGTVQAEALALMAAKLRAAVLLDGDLPEEGLAALDDDGEDVFLALARRLTEDSTADAASLEALFAQAQQSAADADELLVAGDWSVDVAGEPELMSVPATAAALDGVTVAANAGSPVPVLGVPPAHGDAAARRTDDQSAPLQLGFTLPDEPHPAAGAAALPHTNGAVRTLTFDELARLFRRPARKPRPVPDAQLALLDG
jgi:hypothetical protein